MGLSDFLSPVTQLQAWGGWGRRLVLTTSLAQNLSASFTDNLLCAGTELGTPRAARDEPEHVREAAALSWPHMLKALNFKEALNPHYVVFQGWCLGAMGGVRKNILATA